MINIKNLIKSMFVLMTFFLMTGIILFYIDHINQSQPKNIEHDEYTKDDYVMINNDVYGINDALNTYYNVNVI